MVTLSGNGKSVYQDFLLKPVQRLRSCIFRGGLGKCTLHLIMYFYPLGRVHLDFESIGFAILVSERCIVEF